MDFNVITATWLFILAKGYPWWNSWKCLVVLFPGMASSTKKGKWIRGIFEIQGLLLAGRVEVATTDQSLQFAWPELEAGAVLSPTHGRNGKMSQYCPPAPQMLIIYIADVKMMRTQLANSWWSGFILIRSFHWSLESKWNTKIIAFQLRVSDWKPTHRRYRKRYVSSI